MRITEPGKFLRKLLKKETPAKVELTLQDGTLISLNMGTGLVDVNRDNTLIEQLLDKYQEKLYPILYPLSIPEETGKPLSRYDTGILIALQPDGPAFFTLEGLLKHNKDAINFITLNPHTFAEIESSLTKIL